MLAATSRAVDQSSQGATRCDDRQRGKARAAKTGSVLRIASILAPLTFQRNDIVVSALAALLEHLPSITVQLTPGDRLDLDPA